jgi:hypothetical protein
MPISDNAGAVEPPWWRIDDHRGADLAEVMARLHAALAPGSYVEISRQIGAIFASARCASLAIAPSMETNRDIIDCKPACFLFRQPSDAFFASHDPKRYLKSPIALALLDGARHFGQLLRDFINVEKHAARNSVILIPGCLPTDAHAARADQADQSQVHLSATPLLWIGDLWKLVPVLRRYRPQLHIHAVRMPPAGMIAITNLDPCSPTLSDAYFSVLDAFADHAPDQAAIDANMIGLAPQDTEIFLSHATLARHFWV